MSQTDALPTIPCANCRQPMFAQDLERNDHHGPVRVELCFTCAGIWFDHLGSVQLAPAAVIELFKEIHSHKDAARQPLASKLHCPRCGDALELSYDLCKAGRFSYFRCLRGDGRFTPFFQFLREKQFVRSLTLAELHTVRAQVRQIRCSECGAPIDLEHSSQCKYCHAPVSLLDPDAVEKATRMWSEAESRRQRAPAPRAVQNALSQVRLHHEEHAATGSGLALDLVTIGIHAIARLL